MQVYLDLVARVLAEGTRKQNRTGVDTISKFAEFYRVDLSEGYPLLTTKKVNFNAMLHEVLWYLSGADHIRELRQHTKIWDPWADEAGNLETAYGRYWRRFPVPHKGAALGGEVFVDESHPHVRREADGSLSFDQVGWAIDELKRNPNSRRIVISAWHPANAVISKLPPCHFTWVLNVQQGRLNCHLTQRSADIAIGVPFNLACYALLTQAIAQEVGLEPGEFAHTLIDAHIYVNHIDNLQMQLRRQPLPLPRLRIAAKPFDDLRFEDFELVGYQHHEPIKFDVAV
ncbi:MAG: thymidylate synthase [Calditrichaeota bacterium]|nr:MAG: thymidylate synthase [Calditrichota bacterium]